MGCQEPLCFKIQTGVAFQTPHHSTTGNLCYGLDLHLQIDQCFDPEKRSHVTESFAPNPNWKHFLKPSRDAEGMGFGYPKFVSHDVIKSHGTYVKDDVMFIKIKVDKPTHILP